MSVVPLVNEFDGPVRQVELVFAVPRLSEGAHFDAFRGAGENVLNGQRVVWIIGLNARDGDCEFDAFRCHVSRPYLSSFLAICPLL